MGFSSYVELQQPNHVAAGAFFNTFTAFADISPEKPTLGGGVLNRTGSRIQVRAKGEFSCATGVTLSLGVFLGTAATAWASAAFTTGTTPTLWPWELEWEGVVVTAGSAGQILGQGKAFIGSSLTAFNLPQAFPATAAARTVSSINLRNALDVGVGAAWGASAAGNTIKTNILDVLGVNV